MSSKIVNTLQTRTTQNVILLSLVAAILIEVLLAEIVVNNYYSLFKFPWSIILVILIIIASLVYYYLRNWSENVKYIVDRIAPFSILLASIGILLAIIHNPPTGALFILTAYYLEVVVGKIIKKDLEKVDKIGSIVFFAGIILFIIPLLLVLVDPKLAMIPLLGNSLKMVGLLLLAIKIR